MSVPLPTQTVYGPKDPFHSPQGLSTVQPFHSRYTESLRSTVPILFPTRTVYDPQLPFHLLHKLIIIHSKVSILFPTYTVQGPSTPLHSHKSTVIMSVSLYWLPPVQIVYSIPYSLLCPCPLPRFCSCIMLSQRIQFLEKSPSGQNLHRFLQDTSQNVQTKYLQ